MTTNFVPANNGLDWYSVSASAELPNKAGAVIQSSDLIVGARCLALDTGKLYVCTVPTLGAATWVALN